MTGVFVWNELFYQKLSTFKKMETVLVLLLVVKSTQFSDPPFLTKYLKKFVFGTIISWQKCLISKVYLQILCFLFHYRNIRKVNSKWCIPKKKKGSCIVAKLLSIIKKRGLRNINLQVYNQILCFSEYPNTCIII